MSTDFSFQEGDGFKWERHSMEIHMDSMYWRWQIRLEVLGATKGQIAIISLHKIQEQKHAN